MMLHRSSCFASFLWLALCLEALASAPGLPPGVESREAALELAQVAVIAQPEKATVRYWLNGNELSNERALELMRSTTANRSNVRMRAEYVVVLKVARVLKGGVVGDRLVFTWSDLAYSGCPHIPTLAMYLPGIWYTGPNEVMGEQGHSTYWQTIRSLPSTSLDGVSIGGQLPICGQDLKGTDLLAPVLWRGEDAELKRCRVHDQKLSQADVPIIYGVPPERFVLPENMPVDRRFPHAKRWVSAEFEPAFVPLARALVWRCDRCVTAERKWSFDHDRRPRRGPKPPESE